MDVVYVGACPGVAAEQPGGGQNASGPDVLELPERRLVHHEQRLEARPAAVTPGTAGGCLDTSRQVDERGDQLPHLDVSHIALGIEHGGAVVGPVENVLRAHALRGDLEVHDRRGAAVLIDAPSLLDVARHRVGRQHLLDEPAGLKRPGDRAREAGERRLKEGPCDRRRALGVADVRDRALREVGLDREVGAVVDLVVADQRLGEHHPDRPLHARRRAVHRVPAPRRAAIVVELVGAVPADPHLERGVHDDVPARPRGQLHLVGELPVESRRRAVAAGHRHLADAGLERAPALLDHLAAEALETVDALLEEDRARPPRGSCGSRPAGCARRAGSTTRLESASCSARGATSRARPAHRSSCTEGRCRPRSAWSARPAPRPACSRRCRARG